MQRTLQLITLLTMLLCSPWAVFAAEDSSMPGAVVEDAAVAVATVVAIDEETREITLKGPEGDEVKFTAGPEVRNFDQVKRGDRVLMSYYEGFAVALGPKGSGVKKRLERTSVERAEPGEKPAAMITNSIAAVGTVQAIDIDERTVTLRGVERTLVLEVAEEVDLAQIKVGDEAEAVYVESYAVNVVPAPKVSGTVELESTSVALGIGVEWGSGMLTMYDGTTHKFKIKGLSVVDLGVSKIQARGEVFNLVEAKDLNGNFLAGIAGITVVRGGSATAMKNGNGVVMQLLSTQKGVQLTLAPAGLKIELEE
ncbi:MAG: hypothetical protein V2J55_16150 [Candidatus Competibacteraceae bacterium]|jgi:Cu/Ag efflux protein CusF|nr:hypothetical protein [Candidatus Competibacteraceae bacterium]